MKIIALLPVKNEAWILNHTLGQISQFADHIIIADQNSTDGSKEIYKKHPKVKVFNNEKKDHTNEVRWKLLQEARKIQGNNLIFCIDADEILSVEAFKEICSHARLNHPPFSYKLPWIQLWDSLDTYRCDGVWRNNYKTIAFLDDRKVSYDNAVILNDHTTRIPNIRNEVKVDFPLLHLQFLALKRAEIKQTWYKMTELMKGLSARKINYKYGHANGSKRIELCETPKNWLEGIPKMEFKEQGDAVRYMEILSWLDQRGVVFFEPLEIWDLPELKRKFVQATGRLPKVKFYPNFLVHLNSLRHKIKNVFKH